MIVNNFLFELVNLFTVDIRNIKMVEPYRNGRLLTELDDCFLLLKLTSVVRCVPILDIATKHHLCGFEPVFWNR